MNRNFHALSLGLLGVCAAALVVACSSSPGAYGDVCSTFTTENSCEQGFDCRCYLPKQGETAQPTNGCVCTVACNEDVDCQSYGKYDRCHQGTNTSTNNTGFYCFRFKADGGPL